MSDGEPPGSNLFTRLISTAVHSVMAIFPRAGSCGRAFPFRRGNGAALHPPWCAGTDNTTYGPDEVVIKTPSKSYTAFDAAKLITDLGFGVETLALQKVQNGLDLLQFLHPGVNTLVTYGVDVGTPGTVIVASDGLMGNARPWG
jgi:hypothetical protein